MGKKAKGSGAEKAAAKAAKKAKQEKVRTSCSCDRTQ
jgi:hypothetical protein